MFIDTQNMVSMTEANRNFSRVARLVDERGAAVILKNNSPKYVVLEYDQYEATQMAAEDEVLKASKQLMEMILLLHRQLIDRFGGTDGVRDMGLLESALAAPFATFGGTYLYHTLQQMAAQLGYGIIKNHPFSDGNKRTGAHAMLVFLAVNGIELRYTQQELIDTILAVAAGDMSSEQLAAWIVNHEN